jgi:predicted DNA-binding antitoxin AbrB/MazE fold protein
MIANIRARFSDGVLTPLEPLELEDGEEVTLHVENGASQSDAPKKPGEETPYDPNTQSLSETLREVRESVPDSTWDSLPTDGARNYKHYLYGYPKEGD